MNRSRSLLGLSCGLLATAVMVANPLAARADTFQTTPATYEVTTTPFQNGEYGTIRLHPGYGFTLDFSATGHVVERAWLDDITWVGMDFSHGDGERIDSQFVHLKLIPEVDMSQVLTSQDGGTLLTLIAYDPATGKQYRYQFRIFPGVGVPTHTALNVMPETVPETSLASTSSTFSVNHYVNARPEHIQIGLGSYLSELSADEIQQTAEVTGRVRELISLMNNGVEAPAAASQTGVSMQVVNYFATRGLQASPSNPLGLVDDVPPVELRGFSGSAVPDNSQPAPQPETINPSPEIPEDIPQAEPIEPSPEDVLSQSDPELADSDPTDPQPPGPSAYQQRVQAYQSEWQELPAPVELDWQQRKTINQIKIGGDLYAAQHATDDMSFEPRMVALLAHLEAGKSLEVASEEAEFSIYATRAMLDLGEQHLASGLVNP